MTRTGIVYHPIYLEHETGLHPENKERLSAILNRIGREHLNVEYISPEPANLKQVAAIHGDRYIEQVKAICERGGGYLFQVGWFGRYVFDIQIFLSDPIQYSC